MKEFLKHLLIGFLWFLALSFLIYAAKSAAPPKIDPEACLITTNTWVEADEGNSPTQRVETIYVAEIYYLPIATNILSKQERTLQLKSDWREVPAQRRTAAPAVVMPPLPVVITTNYMPTGIVITNLDALRIRLSTLVAGPQEPRQHPDIPPSPPPLPTNAPNWTPTIR